MDGIYVTIGLRQQWATNAITPHILAKEASVVPQKSES